MRRLVVLLCVVLARCAGAEVIGFNEHAVSKVVHYAIGAASHDTPDAASTVWPDADATVDNLTCLASAPPGVGEQWTITVMIKAGGGFVAQAGFCAIQNAAVTCTPNVASVAWATGDSLSFKVVGTTGVPDGSTNITCGLRVTGDAYVHADSIVAPTSGSVIAYGSATVAGTNDFLAMMEVHGTFTTTMHTLACISDTDPGAGNGWTIRVRRGTGSTWAWTNSPINCQITGAGVLACADLVNTQALPDVNGINFLVTAVGTPPAAHLRCGLVYSF